MHNLTLRFATRDVEKAFLEDYFHKTLKRSRFTMFVGILIYAVTGVADAVAYPELKDRIWFIRYLVVLSCIPIFLLAFSPQFKKCMQAFFYLIMLIGGLGVVAMIAVTHTPAGHFSYAGGLFLVTMFCYTFHPMRFLHATLISWFLLIVYSATALWMHTPLYVTVSTFTVLVAANFIGMFASYHYEMYLRRDFLQRRLIQELEEKKHLIEKEKILKNLHDGIGGIAANILLLAEMAKNFVSLSDIKKTLSTISELSKEEISEIRSFMKSLDSKETDWHALVADLRRFGGNTIESQGMTFAMTSAVQDGAEQPDSLLCLNLFRIYKEGLANIVKHSGAKTVTVDLSLHSHPGRLALTLCDDGVGLKGAPGKGRGIPNMKARAEEMGGSLTITSGTGTCVRLEVPIPRKYPDPGIEGQPI